MQEWLFWLIAEDADGLRNLSQGWHYHVAGKTTAWNSGMLNRCQHESQSPALVVVTIWEMNQWIHHFSLSLPLSVTLSFKSMHTCINLPHMSSWLVLLECPRLFSCAGIGMCWSPCPRHSTFYGAAGYPWHVVLTLLAVNCLLVAAFRCWGATWRLIASSAVEAVLPEVYGEVLLFTDALGKVGFRLTLILSQCVKICLIWYEVIRQRKKLTQ